MKFLAYLSLIATSSALSQGSSSQQMVQLDTQSLIQTLQRIADMEDENTGTQAEALSRLSARVDAMEKAQWDLWNKVAGWVNEQPIVKAAKENPIVKAALNNDAVKEQFHKAEDAVNNAADQAHDTVHG